MSIARDNMYADTVIPANHTHQVSSPPFSMHKLVPGYRKCRKEDRVRDIVVDQCGSRSSFYLNVDPDLWSQTNADLSGSGHWSEFEVKRSSIFT